MGVRRNVNYSADECSVAVVFAKRAPQSVTEAMVYVSVLSIVLTCVLVCNVMRSKTLRNTCDRL